MIGGGGGSSPNVNRLFPSIYLEKIFISPFVFTPLEQLKLIEKELKIEK